MKKFAINLDNLKKEVLFSCILLDSEVAQSYDYKAFYTDNQEEPENWYEYLIKDIRSSIPHSYEGETFYTSHVAKDESSEIDQELICYVFFRDKVYCFDGYYTDCPIFNDILRK